MRLPQRVERTEFKMDGLFDCIISVDDHVQEHPNVWLDRLSQRWGDRIPHVERRDAAEYWVIDGLKYPVCQPLTASDRPPDVGPKPLRWSSVPKWTYEPKERLTMMAMDGLSYSVLYPSVAGIAGERFGQIEDPELRLACVQAYNDWLIEEWAAASPSFIPQCIVPIGSVEATVAEVGRSVAKGHKGVIFPALPVLLHGASGLDERRYDPLWEACEKLDVPLCLHSGSTDEIQFPPYAGFSKLSVEAFQAITRPLSSSFTLGTILFSGILLRHPRLKVVFADCPVGWGMFFLEALDYTARLEGLNSNLSPSEIFRRQCFFTFSHESIASTTWKQIDPSNLLWSSHFPLPTSTWPDSQRRLQLNLTQISAEDRVKITWGNAADLYNISRPETINRRSALVKNTAASQEEMNIGQ